MMLYDHCFSTFLQNTLSGKWKEQRGGIGIDRNTSASVDDVNLFVGNVNKTKKNTETLFEARREVASNIWHRQ
jgi:hypothetical protein